MLGLRDKTLEVTEDPCDYAPSSARSRVDCNRGTYKYRLDQSPGRAGSNWWKDIAPSVALIAAVRTEVDLDHTNCCC